MVEEELKRTMNIPVFHDDQHGTAIISSAALLNALELTKKDISKIKVVFNGAGAAAIACAKLHIALGVKKENLIMCDSKGVIYAGRKNDMNKYKEDFQTDTSARTLAEALVGADVFVGLSVKDCVTKEMAKTMAPNAIIFAMANPDPEITPEEVLNVRTDIIMATGRSDYANQVNNVLGFPFIFRGALDVRATTINEAMKIAAVKALSQLAKEDVPDSVIKAYGGNDIRFGREYIIPKPFDPRVLTWVAPAVAKAAIDSGVARVQISDWQKYREELEARVSRSKPFINFIIRQAQSKPRRIVFPEGDQIKILRAAQAVVDQNIAKPILLGSREKIEAGIRALSLDIENEIEIIDTWKSPVFERYAKELYSLRQRKGVTYSEAERLLRNKFYYGAMMVRMGDADGEIAGLTTHYNETIRPALQLIGMKSGASRVSGMYVVMAKKGMYFFADTTVNIDPTAEDLAEIALQTADAVHRFDVIPRIAMLSFSNFGSTKHPSAEKVARAIALIKKKNPELMIDGEMQADTAVVPDIVNTDFPFSTLKGGANVLIFPDLNSANIAYKLMGRIGEAELIGPVLTGMAKPVHVLQRGAEVNDIVNMTAICAMEAGER